MILPHAYMRAAVISAGQRGRWAAARTAACCWPCPLPAGRRLARPDELAMPKDISEPRWICLICGQCFETDLEAAQRCEGAGPPAVLPDGALLLKFDQHGPLAGGTWPR